MSEHSQVSPTIVIFSPVRERSEILSETLTQLERLDESLAQAECWFYDDNDEEASSALLRTWVQRNNAQILERLALSDDPPRSFDSVRRWDPVRFARIATIKDYAISRFLASDRSHLFLLDIDLALHPLTATHLVSLDLPIVSEVFWTAWRTTRPAVPQVSPLRNSTSENEIIALKQPGQFDVSFLGACTLIRRDVLESGVRFGSADGKSSVGEDVHFCAAARAAGWPLVADTCYPPIHIYRTELIGQVRRWREAGCTREVALESLNARWERHIRAITDPRLRDSIYWRLVKVYERLRGLR